MKVLLTAFALLLGSASITTADEAAKSAGTTETKTLKAQTRCPVMGGKIDSSSYTDIQGQRVYHCCPGCTEKLEADPDKYFKKAAADGILFENIQTADPVNGKPHDEKIMLDYEGRRVYFASEKNKETFLKEPAKYLAVLDTQVKKATKAEENSAKDHSDYSAAPASAGHSGGCGH